jgi:quinol monooxygenase YgiN
MITVIATLKVKAGQEETLVAGMKKMIEHVRAHEPGTKTYLLHRSAADPTTFLVYEVYADQAAFAAHGASEPMKEFFKLAGGILDGRPDIAMYEEIDGKR